MGSRQGVRKSSATGAEACELTLVPIRDEGLCGPCAAKSIVDRGERGREDT